jgi:drug/metabolite transporter (DMT)-like permease
MKRIGIVRSVLVISLSSVFGLIFASLFLGELISTQQIIAVVVMLAGNIIKRGNIITSIEETDFKDK